MEFPFSVNDVLPDRANCVDGSLLPDAFKNADKETIAICQRQIAFMLDEIGLSSGIAQGLQSPVTSADRMRDTDHRIYLLTNPSGAGGKGTLVGLLKIGRKKLYVFDRAGKHHELTPICVLDFYVHESMQRNGCGRMLYEHMLQEENINPEFLALDRPSEKLTSFLKKHYDLVHIIPQSNNFVVYDRFFSVDPSKLPGYKSCAVFDKSRAAGKGSHSLMPAHGRALVSRPTCAMDKMMEPKSNGDTDHDSHNSSPRSSYAASIITEDTPELDVQGNHRLQHQRLW